MAPDVSVVVAVFNTVDLLPMTLASLARQTLGPDRVEVVLVDDGSTDGSGQVIDDFAVAYSGPVRTVRQPNSGGPASPFNRGLEVATGRFVFFLGSDDYLWDEALERMVAAADRWNSDVVFGTIVGLDGHGVPTRVYSHGTTEDLDLYTSLLPYALSNSKLFRRSLIESLGLRYREDMRQRCDQPFTLTAIVHGRKTSMLVDGDYYFAQAQSGRANVTYTAEFEESLRSTKIVMDTIAELIEYGPRRDHVMQRQFDTSLARILVPDLLDAAPEVRASVLDGVGSLVDQYLTDGLAAGLTAETRTLLVCAQRRDDEALRRVVIALSAADQGTTIPLVIEDTDVYVALPLFRSKGWPDGVFRSTRRLMRRVGQATTTVGVSNERRGEPVAEVALQISGLDSENISFVLRPTTDQAPRVRARLLTSKPLSGPSVPLDGTIAIEDGSVRCVLRLDPDAMTPETAYSPRVCLSIGRFEYDQPVQALHGPSVDHPVRRWGRRKQVVTLRRDRSGSMLVTRRSAAGLRRGKNEEA